VTYCQKVSFDTKYEDEYSNSNYHAVLARSVLAHVIITNKHNTGLNSSYYDSKILKTKYHGTRGTLGTIRKLFLFKD